jgi:hypothetical protein
LYLSQIPYTGLDLGPVGTIVYWLVLIVVALVLAYFILFYIVPFVNRYVRNFSARVSAVLNEPEPIRVQTARPIPPAPVSAEKVSEAVPSGYSSYNGFKSFARNGALSIEDIVKGLSQENPLPVVETAPEPIQNVEPIHEEVESINENLEPIISNTVATATKVGTDTRGLVIALVEGDRTAVFAGLRQHMRGGGTPGQLMNTIVCLVDDVYRARVDGTACDADIARRAARLTTPLLEKLVASLTTAIDSSYSDGVTGAKLAFTRALSAIGA